MGLLPLEFTDCLTDSPYFRDNLHAHECELDRTSQAIKGIIKEVKDLLVAAKSLSRAQRSLANTFMNFRLECIGNSQTDDEIVIAGSLKEFGRLLNSIEDERDRMLENAHELFIAPIEKFRKDHIGEAKERKKKFDKETAKYCQSLDRYLNLSTKKGDVQLKEAFAVFELEKRHFFKASLEYVLLLQKVQERKKTEFVETILRFMYGWLTFYHQGHEVAKEFNSFNTDLQVRLQKTRENFEATHSEAEQLMVKMLEKPQDSGSLNKMYTRQGYLFLMEKKHLTTIWNKHYCQYQKESRKFTMIPYSQTVGKITSSDTFSLKECIRRMNDTIDKRFCFDLTALERPAIIYTFQALCDEDLKQWLNAMDGKEPSSTPPGRVAKQDGCELDETGFAFMKSCIDAIEARGLEDQGLYRIVGVSSKVTKLTQLAFDSKKAESLNLLDPDEWEVKTITSALKNYLRNLPEPLMTFRLHTSFITAAKQENKVQRVSTIEALVGQLPKENYRMLSILIQHLQRVSQYASTNLMTVSNLGVCFGPTLLRPEEETVAAIMDIKFCNVVVEILIGNCDKIFKSAPKNDVRHSLGSTVPEDARDPPRERPTSREYGSPAYYTQSPTNDCPPSYVAPLDHMQRTYARSYAMDAPAVQKRYGMQLAQSSPPPPVQSMPVKTVPRMALAMYNPSWPGGCGGGGDGTHVNSNSSSTESLSSRSNSTYSHHSPTPGVRELHSSPSVLDTNKSSQSSRPVSVHHNGKRVRTLYACVGENNSELSFEPNQIIHDVRPSREPGWLEGRLNGRSGLIPENYVEFLPDGSSQL
ncbi:rho GTPase-activating protein Graf-like isoform X2 [Ornithodoros turicata]|uniref:rho GTPase-activating protein Graf-like isoform X2 n=1 Tax=Ornithodoros turicata TaxID=34597 RepID=UPI0031395444